MNTTFKIRRLRMMKGLVYFEEHQGYVTGTIMLPGRPPFLNKSKSGGQTKSDPKDPHERYKKTNGTLPGLGLPLEYSLGVGSEGKCLVAHQYNPVRFSPKW